MAAPDKDMMEQNDRRIQLDRRLSRRTLLRLGAEALALPILSRLPVFAATPAAPLLPDRGLSLFNIHTGESLSVDYCRSGCPVSDCLDRINRILRDHRTGEIISIDFELLDLLHRLSRTIGLRQPYHVISGYRSPRSNALLRRNNSRVAANSLHQTGKAVDIRVPRVRLKDLYRAAVSLKSGGVGFYPRSGFIHVDVGDVRTW